MFTIWRTCLNQPPITTDYCSVDDEVSIWVSVVAGLQLPPISDCVEMGRSRLSPCQHSAPKPLPKETRTLEETRSQISTRASAGHHDLSTTLISSPNPRTIASTRLQTPLG